MIVYVNGDSHAAAAEAAVPHAWAEDDEFFWGLGKQPHPYNERVSFGCELANWLHAILICDAQAGGSNARIIRTTQQWISEQTDFSDVFMVIQWSTWEREEWYHAGEWLQVNASGIDEVPEELADRYRQFIVDVDWTKSTKQAHEEIWQFHLYLKELGIRHVMFNGNSDFSGIRDRRDWGDNYIEPYNPNYTYDKLLKSNGFSTVRPDSWHFGVDGHCFWGQFLLQYIKTHNLIDANEIPTY